jgi:chemotaxis receptor (MCP) glutamine deamidase CheD
LSKEDGKLEVHLQLKINIELERLVLSFGEAVTAAKKAGKSATAKKAKESNLVLALEDTTVLSYYHSVVDELGDVGGGKNDVKAAVFGNVGTMQSFKVGAPDAEFLEKEYAPVLSTEDIVGIANYKAYVKLNIDNATSRAFSMNTIFTKDYQNKKIVPILKEYSGKKYGRKREFVDAEMEARLGMSTDETVLPEVPPTEEIPTKIPVSEATTTTPTTQ